VTIRDPKLPQIITLLLVIFFTVIPYIILIQICFMWP